MAKVTAENDFIVVELPHQAKEAAQVALALNQRGEVVAFGVTAVLRSYISDGKTVLRLPELAFGNLELNGKTLPYHIIPDQNAVQIINGLKPPQVAPVKITSLIA
jgi:hypothetical protein